MKKVPNPAGMYPAPKAAPKPMSFVGANGFDLMGGAQPKPDVVPKTSTPKHLIPKTGLRLGLSGGGHA